MKYISTFDLIVLRNILLQKKCLPVNENCSSKSDGKSISRPIISFSKPGAYSSIELITFR